VTKTYEDALAEAFPVIEPGIQPFGSRVLVQVRSPKQKTASGIILDAGTKDTEKWNTQVARVVSVGPLAFKNRTTMVAWPEGSWCKKDDFVRVAKYGGDRWEVALPSGELALFVIFNDLDIIGSVIGDPLLIRAFI
jgi:co-chaperonin GroES (HSP10)|tara:strand:- start:1595 stop:2002 length:408 start_codon:yes stop_codon:yes gene_type:complete